MNYTGKGRDVVTMEIEGLRKVRDNIGPAFDRAVDILLECLRAGKKIVVTGIGKNLHVAQKISATLASTGSTSVFLSPAQAIHGDLGILCAGDALLALSYSGESEELVALLPVVKRIGVRIIALTGDLGSTLAKSGDIALTVAVDREACPFNLAPTASTTATLAMGDALAMVLLEAQGFRREDYAKLHPGGVIGRALLLRVSDIMRTADRLASLSETATVKDALLAMTRARSGSAGIVDGENRLLGIFTDGDLRRRLPTRERLLDMPLGKVMTRSPVTVASDQLAIDVLKTFEEHKIDDLLVVDGQNRLVGAVDIQDLPKFKIL
ncbi:MAG: KpsF/GutQ family sugar-phosphate isomerase [Verrucomicrobiota bacterium]|nr:KpsF/GutQ family sugar-phosphate isomerase [Verrucomicrobiota bacterium]